MNGLFITFEGGEGCGKSTHVALLAEWLRSLGREVVLTREPGGTPLCEAIRGMLQFDAGGESPCPEAETLLFCASRAQLVRNVIRPALARGACVVSDRFADSTLAYQGYGRGFPLDALRSLLDFATGGLRPDATFLLKVPQQAASARLACRYRDGARADRFESEVSEFHLRVREGFDAIAAAEPQRVSVVATDGPLAETAALVRARVEALLKAGEGGAGAPC